MAVRQCESAHCSGADPEINQICKDLGWPVNHPVLTRDSIGPCTCSCSCLAHGTPVEAGDGSYKAIEAFAIGDTVNAAGLDLKWKPANVVFSGGTTGASRQKYTVVVSYDNKGIAVTSDHLFLMADGKLKAADRLTTNDRLVDSSGKSVKIEAIYIGDYFAGFHHVATSKQIPDANLDGHLINTNGIVSGDYTLQLFYRNGELDKHLVSGHGNLEIVGSPEYVNKFGDEALRGPAVRVSGLRSVAEKNARDLPSGTFIPANSTRLKIPPDAAPFISDAEAAQRAQDPRRRWNDPLSREWTEALLLQYHYFYPEIVYTLDWANDTVNAYAWIENNVRHVAILGGLVRHLALELEGIALVIGHETGHHYGGAPTYPGGLSCEGQADYYGVATVMRKVWFGEDYITKTDRGITQMANFFGVPNSPNDPGGAGGCTHPPGVCRIATYHRAVMLAGRPTCAG